MGGGVKGRRGRQRRGGEGGERQKKAKRGGKKAKVKSSEGKGRGEREQIYVCSMIAVLVSSKRGMGRVGGDMQGGSVKYVRKE